MVLVLNSIQVHVSYYVCHCLNYPHSQAHPIPILAFLFFGSHVSLSTETQK